MKPVPGNYPKYYQHYLDLVKENNLVEGLKNSAKNISEILSVITEEKSAFRYEPGKWSVKEVLQHINDTERILSYRALCFSRGENNSLPGFDENAYNLRSFADSRSFASLLEEFELIRKSTIVLFNSLTTKQLSSIGNANGNPVSVDAIGFMIAGHALHHTNVIQARYLL